MRIEQLMEIMETIAPRALAEEWDNPGLLIEPEQREISRVLVALDCTVEVANEAKERGAQLVLTHHPLFFKPVRRIHYSQPDTAAAYALIRQGIGLLAAHTNLDCAWGGVNDALAQALGLSGVRAFPSGSQEDATVGMGRVGMLRTPMRLREFAAYAGQTLGAAARFGGDAEALVSHVALIGGSGGKFAAEAKAAGADVLLSGEVKHNEALDARMLGIGIVEAGHYETERVVLAPLIAGLQAAQKDIQCMVDFMLSKNECAPLIAP